MAYINVLYTTALMFFFMLIMTLPIWYIYYNGSSLKHIGLVQQTFAGNLGATTMLCEHAQLDMRKLTLQCEPDFVLETHSMVFGLISNEFENH